MMKDALTIERLNVQINQQHILQDFSLSLDQGDILCLLGPSGCGKTTALKAIAGLIPAADGHIKLFDNLIQDANDSFNMPPEKRGMGFIFQDYALFPHLTVFDNVAFSLKGQSKSEIVKKVSENLKLVQLSGLENRYPHQLSGGQQQRTAVARALSSQPKLLLMDEPFSNVDNQVKQQMMAELRGLLKANNITCIFVTHSKQEAFSFADKTAVLNNGCIEQVDITKNIFEHPNNVFVARFMEAGNIISGNDLPQLLFNAFKPLNDACYLLKENGFKIETDKSEGAKGLITDCLYIGYRYQLSILIIDTGVSINAESTEPFDINHEVSLKYLHNPVLISN
jgi:iron(III) transport system ATP-binding protein